MKRVPVTRLFSLAARQLLRDARAGELRVLFFALLVAVAASSAIGYFSARLNDAMLLRASEFLAADLRLSGSSPASQEQIDAGLKLGLDHAQAVEFSSVVAAADGIQLASVKAANSRYPLRGELRSAAEPYAPEEVGSGPRPGEAWAEARLMVALNLKIGDELEIGAKTLRLSRVLTYDPDTAGDFYSLTPHVLMHLDDLAATEVVQPGSRVRFRELWRGDADTLAAYRQAVEAGLEPNQRLDDARDGNRQVGGALGRAERYLNLASLAAVLLAGVAVALSSARFAARRFDASALLRCLGLSRREALALFGLQLALLGLVACLIGALLGWAGQHVLFYLLRGLIPDDLPPADLWPALAGMATGLVALAGFALPPLAALGRVPPLRVLRRDMLPLPASSWLVYGA
ncbi:FtsX-like permease family protein, partial [Ectopseudomonas oleovorans]|uniref:ABC transporter permease n=1 Tax=Ectopseudomonas oleovorans TaxID=301 RepID=UPI00311A5BC3